jgi:hypothetical protein
MAGRTKKASAEKTNPLPPALTVPFRVIPLEVYAAWRSADWLDMHQKDVYFTVVNRRIILKHRNKDFANHNEDLGPLPEGWDHTDVNHDDSGVHGCFIGPAETIKRLEELRYARVRADDEIGSILHYNFLDGNEE